MARLIVAALVIVATAARTASAQSGTWPSAVEDVSLPALAGEWHEVAAFGSWAQRRCISDTQFRWSVRDARTVDVSSTCTTSTGQEVRTGRLRAPAVTHRGRLAVRFAPAFLAWLPAAWSDHWVLAVGEGQTWLLIGDRHRSRLSVLARVTALDEAAFAQAIRLGRIQGFDVDRLVAIPQSGSGAVSPR